MPPTATPDSPPRSQRGRRPPPSRNLSTPPGSSRGHRRPVATREAAARPGRNDRHLACGQPHEETHPSAKRPYPSFCFSSLLMGAAPAVHMDVAVTRQSAAVVATRLHGARWGTGDPQPRPPPASLMAPRFRARAATTPGRWDTSPDAGGEGAASPAEGGMRRKASGRRRRTVSRSRRAGPQRQCCHRPPPSAAGAPPPAFRCRSLGNHLPRRYFRVGPQTLSPRTNADRLGEGLAPGTGDAIGPEK